MTWARSGDPYVALTRATHRLPVVYVGDLPAWLHRRALIRLLHP